MARPAKTTPSVNINLAVDPDLMAKVRLEVFSEVEGKVPHGAYSGFFNTVLKEYFTKQELFRLGD